MDAKIRLNLKNAIAVFGRASAYYHKGQLDRAFADYDEAIRLDPQKADYLVARGRAYTCEGRSDLAFVDFDEAIMVQRNCASALYNRGLTHATIKQHNRAIADYDEAIGLDPGNAMYFCMRGHSYNVKGQYSRAIADYSEAIWLDPKNVQAFFGRAFACERKDQLDRAIADYDEAIRLDANFTLAIDNRAEIIARKNELSGGATNAVPATRAIIDGPGGAAGALSYGWLASKGQDWVMEKLGLRDALMVGAGITQSKPTAKLVTPQDEQTYGIELIDLAKRAAREAVDPELNALGQEIISLKQKMGMLAKATSAPAAKLLTPKEEREYGIELIDLVKRSARETVDPELNALGQEITSLKQKMGMPAKANEAPAAKLVTPQDEQTYGIELIDLAKRAAREAVDPELNALGQTIITLKQKVEGAK